MALLAFAITDLLDLWKIVRGFHQSICLRATEEAHTAPVGVMVLHFLGERIIRYAENQRSAAHEGRGSGRLFNGYGRV